MLGGMQTHVAYEVEQHRDATACLAAIRQRVDDGWHIVEIRGTEAGPYVVVFGRDASP